MSKGIYIGLASVLFLAVVGGLALFNTWQIANIEERQIATQQSVDELKVVSGEVSKLSRELRDLKRAINERPVAMAPTPGAPGAPGPAASDCPNNLLAPGMADWMPAAALEAMNPGATLVRAIPTGSKGFNPLTESGADVSEIERYVNAYLAIRDPQEPDVWRPMLARCIEANDDFTEYTVHLRPGVRWQAIQGDYLQRSPWLAGEHLLTADDYLYTFKMIMDPAVEGAAPLRTYYADVERLEKIDDLTFKVIWKRKTFQSKTFTLGLSAVPAWIYAHDPDGNPYAEGAQGQSFNQHWYRHMMGVGPYRMDSFAEDQHIKLVRNLDYFGEEPAFETIIYKVVSDGTQRLAQFENQELDYTELSPAQYSDSILSDPSTRFVRCDSGTCELAPDQLAYTVYPRMAYRYIGWNMESVYFKDARVRRAMTHALNRQKALDDIFRGLGTITSGNFYTASPEYNQDIKPYAYDLAEARRLLDEAGWVDTDGDNWRDKDGQRFEFTLLVYGYRPEFITLAQLYKQDLADVGVLMNIKPLAWSALQTKTGAREFDAFTGGWALSWESDPYQIWHSSQADQPESSNMVSFRNAEADQIIEEARETFDLERRIALFHRFHEIVHEEQPYTFLFASEEVGAWQPAMRNVVFQKIRPHDLSLPWYKVLP